MHSTTQAAPTPGLGRSRSPAVASTAPIRWKTRSCTQGGTLTLTGIVQNGAGVNATWAKTGDGDVVLSGGSANTYSGLTRVFGGRLILEKDGALGTAGSSSSSTGNTFQNTGSASTIAFRAPGASPGINYSTYEVINTNGTGAPGFAQVDNLGGDNTFAGSIAFDGPTVGGARQATIGVGPEASM